MNINLVIAAIVLLTISYSTGQAEEPPKPIPISAEQAFDAVQTGRDPNTGEEKGIALVDVRSRAEYYWVGAPCQVDDILTSKGVLMIPDNGKVRLSKNSLHLLFKLNGRKKRVSVRKVSKVALSPIAINIPFKFWEDEKAALVKNEGYAAAVESLHFFYDILIFFCRNGDRSKDCLGKFDVRRFEAIYEIDQPDGKTGRGGFEGTAYDNRYNGYRGYPGRLTDIQEHPSVSWKEAGLPMKTSVNPLSD